MANGKHLVGLFVLVAAVAAFAYIAGLRSAPQVQPAPTAPEPLALSPEAQQYAPLGRNELIDRLVAGDRDLAAAESKLKRERERAFELETELAAAATKAAAAQTPGDRRGRGRGWGRQDDESTGEDLTPGEVAVRVETLTNEFRKAMADADGEAAVDVIRQLSQLGSPAYPALVQALNAVYEDRDGDNTLDLNRWRLYRAVGRDAEFYSYALADDTAHTDLRVSAVHGLSWGSDGENLGQLIEQLERETEGEVVEALARHLGRSGDEAAVTALSGAIERAGDDSDAVSALLFGLAGISSDSASTELRVFAETSENSEVRETAQAALSMTLAPEPGFGVTEIIPNGQAAGVGLQAGDVITSYNGRPVSGMRSLWGMVRETGADDEITIEYYRAGERGTAEVSGGMLGLQGMRVGNADQNQPR
jgi:hypothetical protein